MYWLAKVFQAAGLGVIAWGFIKHFPNLMPHNVLLVALVFFAAGWIIQTYLLKK